MNRLLFVIVATALATTQQGSSQSSSPGTQAWGLSVDGLRIGISAISTTVPSVGAQFMIGLQNTTGEVRRNRTPWSLKCRRDEHGTNVTNDKPEESFGLTIGR